MLRNICVFCSANEVGEKYVKAAQRLGTLLVKHGYGLVYGGSERGLMKVTAGTVEENGGCLTGVTTEFLKDRARKSLKELVVTKDFAERKAVMIQRSDAIVLLVGGTGSLDEITEILELKKHDFYHHPVVVLNTDHFYDGLKIQLEKMYQEGFLAKDLNELVFFAESPEEAMGYIDNKLN